MATEKQILRSSIADHNKQHPKGTYNYVKPTYNKSPKHKALEKKYTPWHKEAKEHFKNRKAPEGIGYGESKEHKERWTKFYKSQGSNTKG